MRTQIYTFKITTDPETGKTVMHRKNDGFNALELMGICTLIQHEVRDQICGKLSPDVVKREVVTDKE